MEKILKYILVVLIAYLTIKYVIAPLGALAVSLLPVILVIFAIWYFYKKL